MPRRHVATIAAACLALAGGVPQAHTCQHSGRTNVRPLPEAVEHRKKRPQNAEETAGDVFPANPQTQSQPASARVSLSQHELLAAFKNRLVTVAAEDPVYLTKQEAAAIARVSISTIDRAIRQHKLRAGGSIGLIRIRPEWLYEWIDSREGRAK